jgi:hypothetical protein
MVWKADDFPFFLPPPPPSAALLNNYKVFTYIALKK